MASPAIAKWRKEAAVIAVTLARQAFLESTIYCPTIGSVVFGKGLTGLFAARVMGRKWKELCRTLQNRSIPPRSS